MAHRNFARAQRRSTSWLGFGDESGSSAALGSMQTLAVGTPSILSQLMVRQGQLEDVIGAQMTLTRTIGNITARLTPVTADAEARVAIGGIVVREAALTSGVGSMPSPEDEPDADWFYYEQFDIINPAASSIAGASAANTYRSHFDVKGQRIMRDGFAVVWLAEAQDSVVEVGVCGRYLVKLS